MTYQHPVGQPEDPYERYKVERIEADKKTRGESRGEGQTETKPPLALGAYLLVLFQRFLDFFEDTSETGMSRGVEREVRNNLAQFKEILEILQREDRSQDSSFLNLFSHLWHKILEDPFRFRKETPLTIQFKTFMKEVDSYPKGQEFTLGYYLTEYAGQKWLPFPYMDLVRKLHDDHEKNPEGSPLAHWTRLIDELTSKMNGYTGTN